mmetsp:Transcript_32306/g.30807  ORF Transcript_32306/g.30807 Transcript_32306/m.30807 type:complete len:847 (-) Transcript_32306:33-2573(-)|eukprot:CAMPEP_0119045886 /NCGR_PEP_ID=MMETSP1177-20130426/43142_1 /TAXON_ID=2985 /ORGANISM="Ochromonas sp, Strain CCMP1899" /LENGTH=846 /DNA_ID=CAMNT_0007018327 /DNA_START=135 /DNA_END=2675 /DNA_ORIENTATION=+
MDAKIVASGKNLEKRQLEHHNRMKKIKGRKPFSSVTLDNAVPRTTAGQGFANSRRNFEKKLLSHTTEQENRCLLQRISQILTAPPKLSSDDNYNKMKMLVGSLKPGSSTYDKKLMASKQEKFFGNLKNIDSFYHADQWESDYQKQLQSQEMFLRQVRYKRPKGFVDPFAEIDPLKISKEKDDSDPEDTDEALRDMFLELGHGSHSNTTKSMSFNGNPSKPEEASGKGVKQGSRSLQKIRSSSAHVDKVRSHMEDMKSKQDGLLSSARENLKLGVDRSTGGVFTEFSGSSGDERERGSSRKGYSNRSLDDVPSSSSSRRGEDSKCDSAGYSSTRQASMNYSGGHSVDVMSIWDDDNDSEKNHHEYNKIKYYNPGSSRGKSSRHKLPHSRESTPQSRKVSTYHIDSAVEDEPQGNLNMETLMDVVNDYRTAPRKILATLERSLRVYTVESDRSGPEDIPPIGSSTCAFTPRSSECRSFSTVNVDLNCWVLKSRKTLLIKAKVPDSFPIIDIEAELSINDLARSKNLEFEDLMNDMLLLKDICMEILSEVELTVENIDTGGGAIDSLVEKDRRAMKAEKLNKIVVHMRRKGLKKHSSIADAFMDIFNTENENRTHSFDVSDIHQTGCNDKDVYSNLNFSQSLDTKDCEAAVTADPPKVHFSRNMDVLVTHTIPLPTAAQKFFGFNTKNQTSAESKRRLLTKTDSDNDMKILAQREFNKSRDQPQVPISKAAAKLLAEQPPPVVVIEEKAKPRKEKIPCLISVNSNHEKEKVLCTVEFLQDSQDNSSKKVAIAAGTKVSLTTGMPSIMQADPELSMEFFDNLLDGLSIEHDSGTRKNTCYLNLESHHKND